MGDIAIRVKNLSKCYRIYSKAEVGRTLREVISDVIKAPLINFRKLRMLTRFEDAKSPPSDLDEPNENIVWALRDVSLEVSSGDVIGIIGPNGAGKSTFLKILSRVTFPTCGEIDVFGRISSLLEVGTGFHPELTGRENIYLNGAILGMSRKEIDQKFDEIVEFAGIEKFIDTPVKRYSSGMYVRLAFAVGAHLESEILLIDEVLAVGDAAFQRKCLKKMGELGVGGRTVLFVSHNMSSIQSLCNKVVLFENGRVEDLSSNVEATIQKYLQSGNSEVGRIRWENESKEFRNAWFYPTKFYLGDRDGNEVEEITSRNKEVFVYIEGDINKERADLQVGYSIEDEKGSLLYWSCHNDSKSSEWPRISKGKVLLRSKLPLDMLNLGSYRIKLICALYNKEWICNPYSNSCPTLYFSIYQLGNDSPFLISRRPGLLSPVIKWERVG